MNDLKATIQLNRFLDRRTKVDNFLQKMQDEKDSKPEITPELTATSKGSLKEFMEEREKEIPTKYEGLTIKKLEEALNEIFYRTEVFTNENGTVYQTIEGGVPDGATALSIEGQIYYSSLAEVQALQDFLSLRVQKAKEAEIKFKKTFTPIKKNRNKMLHLTPKKKKR